jgi:hypothetical protein
MDRAFSLPVCLHPQGSTFHILFGLVPTGLLQTPYPILALGQKQYGGFLGFWGKAFVEDDKLGAAPEFPLQLIRNH